MSDTDRSASIVGLAAVETLLSRLLSRVMLPDRQISDGTFTSRRLRELCYSLGILTDEENRLIDILAVVRNRFAHRWEDRSFDDADIVKAMNEVGKASTLPYTVGDKFPAKWIFIGHVIDVWAHLVVRHGCLRNGFPPRHVPEHLLNGLSGEHPRPSMRSASRRPFHV
jgi:hypothetical protein